MTALVPDDFEIPLALEADGFRLRKLTVADAEKDYEAVISSQARLTSVFSRRDGWPPQNLTVTQNREDLAWHETEFDARRSFTYTVVSPDEAYCMGCVYIYPPRIPSYDAEVYLWVRDSLIPLGFDQTLYNTARGWLRKAWPFPRVAFPGRDIPWPRWEELLSIAEAERYGPPVTRLPSQAGRPFLA